MLSSDVDTAISKFSQFINKVNSIVSSGDKSISTLNSIKTAEHDISIYDQLIKSSLQEMNRFKKWSKGNEESEILSKVASYKPTKEKSEILSNHAILKNILKSIDDIKRKWNNRKEEEEEIIRRAERRRREEEEEREAQERRSRNDSSSSSSSSSSFSGFGGGGSGSSGSSSDW